MLTEWDKYNMDNLICRKVGCGKKDMEVCCPELMDRLCNPKRKLLMKLNISEKDLDTNKVFVEDIKKNI